MSKVAYLILCHKAIDRVIKQAEMLIHQGDYVVVHFDKNGSVDDFAKLSAFADKNRRVILADQVACGWGEWSLVEATLNCLQTAYDAFSRAEHFYLISGDCVPIKPAKYIQKRLAEENKDFIEHHDFYNSGWIKTGMIGDRLHYRHFFNEREKSGLFYWSLALQKRLRLRRKVPDGLDMKIGSQWFCLRRKTIRKILRFVGERKDVVRFFKTVWIPDECFFQTLVANLVPSGQVYNRTPTFLMFTDYGKPVTFHDDHLTYLQGQDAFFARKVSENADGLRVDTAAHFAQDIDTVHVNSQGKRRFEFVVNAGRNGRRYGPRIWERTSSLGRERTLHIILCKKWYAGRKFGEIIQKNTGIPSVGYVFDDSNLTLPKLGGHETQAHKRNKHRRAFLRILFDHFETDRLIICIDPRNVDAVQDFYNDICTTKSIFHCCSYSREFLEGHARRAGLADDRTTAAEYDPMLPTIEMDFNSQLEHLRTSNLAHFSVLELYDERQTKLDKLVQFLDCSQSKATKILTGIKDLHNTEETS